MSYLARVVSGGNYCGNKVAIAIRKGQLRRPSEFPCTDCGGAALQYDHRDYNKPLDVDPVCRSCNRRRGKAIPRRWEREELLATLVRYCEWPKILPHCREWCIDAVHRRVDGIEELTGGEITRADLRPDVFN